MIELNLLLFLVTTVLYISYFFSEGKTNVERGLAALRFFTVLSNLFCAFASLLMAVALLGGIPPRWVWLVKYVSTVAVSVTFTTVMVFLGPQYGYADLFRKRDLYFHLIGPLLALVSFCITERFYPLSFASSLLGEIPVILYGAFYLYKVVLGPDTGRWDDFYGYNKDGKWPISFTAMIVGGALLCVALWLLYRL
jgi:hypothetical protein